MGKGKGKVDGDGASRQRTISWDDEQTKFMLNWYIDYRKEQHAGFIFKKQHHMKCADALNKEFAMGVTLDQVDRHYRHYKENWKIVETALNKSGNGFDKIKCKVTISESEKEQLSDRARRLLSKPIKFFHEMQELFSGMNADGSLAMDPETGLDDGSDPSDSESEELNDMSMYPQSIDLEGNDSDTIPAPPSSKVAASGGIGSSKKHQAGKKRPRDVKSPTKKMMKQPKSRFVDATEHITATMKAIQQTLANPPPAPQLPQLIDPSVALWQRIEAINISAEDKILIGEYLASPTNEGMRSFLSYSSDKTLETWVYKFICKHEDRLQ